MALWIIAIVLIIVFFPILFGVAATAAMIIIPLALMAFSIFSIVHFAKESVTNPTLGRRVGLGIVILYFFLELPPISRWMYAHNNGIFYTLMISVTAFGICLLMLSKNRGIGGGKGVAGISILLMGALLQTTIELMMGSYYYITLLPVQIGLKLFTIVGYVLLLIVPAHSDTPAEEKNGVLLITSGCLIADIFSELRIIFSFGIPMPSILYRFLRPVSRYLSPLLLIAGAVLYAKSMLSGGKNKEN